MLVNYTNSIRFLIKIARVSGKDVKNIRENDETTNKNWITVIINKWYEIKIRIKGEYSHKIWR